MNNNNLKLFTFIVIGFLGISISSCKKTNKEVKPIEVTFKKEGELNIFKSQSDSLIVELDIEIADTDYDIQTGLMYRNSMQSDRGMLFVFPTMRQRYFYMRNTKIPLDLIFIDDNKYIVSFQENAKPFDEESLPSQVPAQYVLEVNAGLAEKWLLDIGDRIEFTENQ
ncbi:MAG: DUF192 domain-containing protein [Bacteroidia bacterium]|nr:DUF192 domain-containing protein [Bacteroidia bacterium]